MNNEILEIAPSILSADFTNLGNEIEEIKKNIKYLHIDVMDGHFVPNISIGIPVIESLRPKFPDLIFDTHLMITNPENYVEPFAAAGSDIITFHREVNINPTLIIQKIKKTGKIAGISINPDTDVHLLDSVLDKADLILIMSVFPGFGGQKFICETLKKIEYLKEKKIQKNYKYLIEIDGGVNIYNAKQIIDAGTEILVAGSAVFNSKNKNEAIKEMLKLKNK
ncbi:ribulose-phosphate 3-epimerase [Candidatus Dependentiae bacterium]|nr:ribulose-phosphate 3-epimerase [Candidatus Dependentiae bacterium]